MAFTHKSNWYYENHPQMWLLTWGTDSTIQCQSTYAFPRVPADIGGKSFFTNNLLNTVLHFSVLSKWDVILCNQIMKSFSRSHWRVGRGLDRNSYLGNMDVLDQMEKHLKEVRTFLTLACDLIGALIDIATEFDELEWIVYCERRGTM